MKIIVGIGLALAALLCGLSGASAQSAADPAQPGYLRTANCPGATSPCFVPYLLPVTPSVSGSAATSLVAKAAPGALIDAYAVCSSACWMLIYNAVADPGNGSTVAGTAAGNLQDCIGSGTSFTINYQGSPPETFSTGIVIVISSTGCATETQSAVGFIHARVQ